MRNAQAERATAHIHHAPGCNKRGALTVTFAFAAKRHQQTLLPITQQQQSQPIDRWLNGRLKTRPERHHQPQVARLTQPLMKARPTGCHCPPSPARSPRSPNPRGFHRLALLSWRRPEHHQKVTGGLALLVQRERAQERTSVTALIEAADRLRSRIRRSQISTPQSPRQQGASRMDCRFRRTNRHWTHRNRPSNQSHLHFDHHNLLPAVHRSHTTSHSIHSEAIRFRVLRFAGPTIASPRFLQEQQDRSPKIHHLCRFHRPRVQREFRQQQVGRNMTTPLLDPLKRSRPRQGP